MDFVTYCYDVEVVPMSERKKKVVDLTGEEEEQEKEVVDLTGVDGDDVVDLTSMDTEEEEEEEEEGDVDEGEVEKEEGSEEESGGWDDGMPSINSVCGTEQWLVDSVLTFPSPAYFNA
jgi:hypothetical protein